MPQLQRKSLSEPEEVRRFPNGWIDIVHVGEKAFGLSGRRRARGR
jgi:hypothetical protein